MAGIETWNGVVGQDERYKIRLLDRLDEAVIFRFVSLADEELLAPSAIAGVSATNADIEPSVEMGEVEIDLQKTAK